MLTEFAIEEGWQVHCDEVHRSEGNIREGTFVKGIGKGQAHESWGTVMAADGGQT